MILIICHFIVQNQRTLQERARARARARAREGEREREKSEKLTLQ